MHQCPLYWLADKMISTNIKFGLFTDFDPSQFSLECSHCTQPSAIGQNSIPKQTPSNGEMTIPKSLYGNMLFPGHWHARVRIHSIRPTKLVVVLSHPPSPAQRIVGSSGLPGPPGKLKVGTLTAATRPPTKQILVPWMISCYIDFCHFTLHRLVSCSAGARWN